MAHLIGISAAGENLTALGLESLVDVEIGANWNRETVDLYPVDGLFQS